MNYKALILLPLIALLIGCDDQGNLIKQIPPAPTIAVERLGAYTTKTDNVIMIITFKNLKCLRGEGRWSEEGSIKITTAEQLSAFKEQVKFLIDQIEDAEVLIKTKEPKSTALGGG